MNADERGSEEQGCEPVGIATFQECVVVVQFRSAVSHSHRGFSPVVGKTLVDGEPFQRFPRYLLQKPLKRLANQQPCSSPG